LAFSPTDQYMRKHLIVAEKKAQHMLGIVIHQTKSIAATPWQEIPALYNKLDETLNSHLALKWFTLNLVRSKGSGGAMFNEFKVNV